MKGTLPPRSVRPASSRARRPFPGTAAKPVGLVYIGLAVGGEIDVKKNLFSGDRGEIRRQTVETALALIAEKCLENEWD